jgi:hypothetical protein
MHVQVQMQLFGWSTPSRLHASLCFSLPMHENLASETGRQVLWYARQKEMCSEVCALLSAVLRCTRLPLCVESGDLSAIKILQLDTE